MQEYMVKARMWELSMQQPPPRGVGSPQGTGMGGTAPGHGWGCKGTHTPSPHTKHGFLIKFTDGSAATRDRAE